MNAEQPGPAFAVAAAPEVIRVSDLDSENPVLTVSDVKGVPPHRRRHIVAALVAGGSGLGAGHEAWVVPARKPPAYSVRIIGPRGFYRQIPFSGTETDAEIEQRVRAAVEA